MTELRIAASLWSVDPSQQAAEADRLADAGLQVWHWDRSDGSMARAGGFSAADARALAERTGLRSEAHLMLHDPAGELADWLAFCERVIVHVEADGWAAACDTIRRAGAQVAVAIAPSTNLDDAHPPSDAAVLVMSVQPGEAGATFDPDAVGRVAHWSAGHEVGVDGGVDLARAADCTAAGARWLVSGTSLTAAEDPHAWLRSAEGGRRAPSDARP